MLNQTKHGKSKTETEQHNFKNQGKLVLAAIFWSKELLIFSSPPLCKHIINSSVQKSLKLHIYDKYKYTKGAA